MHPGDALGRYELIEPVGRGGMAEVWKALDPATKRHVAIKLLPPGLSSDPAFLARFRREAETVAALEHPHIVPLYDVGLAGEQPYLVMRYLAGGTLQDRLASGPLPLQDALALLNPIASALDFAHLHAVVHRDIKPRNVLFDERGTSFLADFGIARPQHSDARLTETGATVGTLAYMAPEQFRQGASVDARTDVYALACVLFEVLAGQVPFQGDTASLIAAHLYEPPPSIQRVNGSLPESLDAVIARGMAKEPDERFPSAGQLMAAVASGRTEPARAHQSAGLPAARPYTSGQRDLPAGRPSRVPKARNSRWPLALALGGGGLLGLICLAGAAVLLPLVLADGQPTLEASPGATADVVVTDAPVPTNVAVATESQAFVIQERALGQDAATVAVELADVWESPRTTDDPLTLQTQVIAGERVVVVGEMDDWYRIIAVEQPSSKDTRGYPGWVRKAALIRGWAIARRYAVVMAPTTSARAASAADSAEHMALPMDTRLPVLSEAGDWVEVRLPDERHAWVAMADVRVTDDLEAAFETDRILDTAASLIGVPYLWGGTSSRGFDCSGFTYRVFHAHGITLPRDSRDQAAGGQAVALDALQPRDLIFTSPSPDRPISHVAIVAGDAAIIDCATPATGVRRRTFAELLSTNTLREARDYLGSPR